MDDLISRQAAIDALKNDMASLDNIIKGMSAYDVRLDAYVSQRNQVNCDIDTINNLPTAQPEQHIDADGTLWITVTDIERVKRVIVDEDKSKFCRQFYMDAQPQRTCVNCGRTANNGGWYADGRTRCPIEEHYALPKDGYCHLWEKRNVTDDDYPERREE